ncbi:MAG: EamA family transporter [Acidobacteria bacterium]|nr:EamA family transporter [Acidobacteriota bacterium]
MTGLLIVLASAFLHVIVHLVLKLAKNPTAFLWWMWFWAIVLFFPVLLFTWHPIPLKVWLVIILSAGFGALYYKSIAEAYKIGELSTIYPLARGTAPIFLLFWSVLLLEERPSWGGIFGISLIAFGLYTINLPKIGAWKEIFQALEKPAARWALLAGLCTSLYTTCDKFAVGFVSPLLYTYLTMFLTLIYLTPGTLKSLGKDGLFQELKLCWSKSILAGILAMSIYIMLLWVMQKGMPASYVGATREISVVLAAIVGTLILKEQGTKMKLIGSSLIASGVGTIALLG